MPRADPSISGLVTLKSRARGWSGSGRGGSRATTYDFSYREPSHAPEIYIRCADSDNGDAMISKRMRKFGEVMESVGIGWLLAEFKEMLRRLETAVDEVC